MNKNYYSLTLKPTFYKGRFSLGSNITIGEERFSVKNNGFVLNNSPDLYKKQISGFLGIRINNIYLKGAMGQSTFVPYGGQDESISNFTVFSLSFSF